LESRQGVRFLRMYVHCNAVFITKNA
jgi:hypothetical protein